MTASMQVVDTAVSDVVVKFRLRQPSEDKVNEIAESISQVGLINPITIDKNKNLLAGFHRYLCLLYTSPSPRDRTRSRMPSSA